MKQYFFLFFFATSFYITAQESVFFSEEKDSLITNNKFNISVYNLNFIKNNEYFNDIADGFTLLGTHLQPEIIYNSSDKTQFRAGVFLMKNFGEHNIDYAIPTFSFNYFKNNSQITIGNLYSRNNHTLIEPLMASEKILSEDIIETGFEYKYKTKNIYFDAWLNWENYIRRYSEEREVFTMGLASKTALVKNFSLPIQYIYYHKGGQINNKYRSENSIDNSMNFHNISLGLEYKTNYNPKKGFTIGHYYLLHSTKAKTEYPFTEGYAHYTTLNYKTEHFNFLLAHYKANKFISAKGNEMFQSYSLKSNVNYWNGVLDNRYLDLTEPDRNLLFSKLFYQNQIANNVKLGFQLECYYQLNNGNTIEGIEKNTQHQFDYSYGVFLLLNDVFKL
ncbi:hypothetical protein [Mariniflexile sp.]|uniref:hypothetical protein n=1 Tax=Mariniflexile sp. TaxID=1979402 RepID=UPI0035626575